MNKQQLTRAMEQSLGAFPNTTAIRNYFGWGKTRTVDFLAGLDFIECGRSKQYWVGDVAEKLLSEKKTS